MLGVTYAGIIICGCYTYGRMENRSIYRLEESSSKRILVRG
jgi:hypothetical protein